MSRKGSLDACTVLELKEKAAKRGIKVTGLNKAEIIAKLRGKQTGNGVSSLFTKKKVDYDYSEIEDPKSLTRLIYPENTEFLRINGTGSFFLKNYKPPPPGKKGVYGTFYTSFTDRGQWQFNNFNDYILPSELETNYKLVEGPPVPLPRRSFD